MKIRADKGSKEYKIENVNECEYMDEMKKYYFERPYNDGRSCNGFRNKYNGKLSAICSKCCLCRSYFKESRQMNAERARTEAD